MRFNLSQRERKLVALLTGVIAVFLWYQVFLQHLWPRYQELQQDRTELVALELDLTALIESVSEKEDLLAELKGRIDGLKNRLAPGSGFLVHTIGKLAEGKVIIKEMEPQESRLEPFYRVNVLRVVLQGDFSCVMEYLELLEDQRSLRIESMVLTGGQHLAETVEVDLLLHHYLIAQGEGGQPAAPSTLYEPYHFPNPFARKSSPEPLEPPEQQEEVTVPLAPYTFPIK